MADTTKLWSDIDEAVRSDIVESSDLDYDKISQDARSEYTHKKEPVTMIKELSDLWVKAYKKSSRSTGEILEFSDGYYQCLFDFTLERVISFYGLSQPTSTIRDKNRQAGFIPGFTDHYHDKDRGHFLSHRQGGGMDVNFFPQKKEINRGWSDAGKIYRKMETYCSKNLGIFCFSRPIYKIDNETWDPDRLEYGIFDNNTYRVVVFPN